MKTLILNVLLILLLMPGQVLFSQSRKDSLKYCISINYLIDLSDTYGGGEMFTSEFGVSRSWYGADLSYGHFMSQSEFIFKIPLEESGYVLEIPFEEVAIMKMGVLSVKIIPIQGRRFSTELLFGATYAKAERLCSKGVEYTFDTTELKFTSLTRDYQLIRGAHFGYQVGLRISYYPLKRAGLEFNVRIQDLRNGGTFFLVGGGFCFKL